MNLLSGCSHAVPLPLGERPNRPQDGGRCSLHRRGGLQLPFRDMQTAFCAPDTNLTRGKMMISTTSRRYLSSWTELACHYHIVTQWRIPGTPEEVADSFLRLAELSEWWPQFLAVNTLEAGDRNANGRRVKVITKGFLPYKLRFEFRLTHVEYPSYFSLQSQGDFNGCGRGWLSTEGEDVIVDFDWQIEVKKPLLRRWSWLLKPLFITNHRWLMAQGQAGLRRNFSVGQTAPALAS